VFWAEEEFLNMYIEVRMLWREGMGIRKYHLMNGKQFVLLRI
jgi:hypothetical protein